MPVRNVHERTFRAGDPVGALIDTLASPDDALWPRNAWPRMAFDRPLQVGAIGGHGPIRYVVEHYRPGTSIRFRFTAPAGFDGWHGFELVAAESGAIVLRHTLAMTTHGIATLTWPLVYRPLHDALLEDALAAAQAALGYPPTVRPWSAWVRALRWLLSRRRAP
jgi:hypothetical protein